MIKSFWLISLLFLGFLMPLNAIYAQETTESLLDVNTASDEELLAVPGIGEKILDEIHEYRPFASMEHFRAELGKYIDEEALDELAKYIAVLEPSPCTPEADKLDLNTASDEELLAVPGIGENILHEIHEYRPFTSMEHFRAELGKYIDEEALDALAEYVTIDTCAPVSEQKLDLNTASDEELLAVPGLGEKILDEIHEYRPFTSMEHFRAELGKYIDEEALDALAEYVTVTVGVTETSDSDN